MGQPKSRPRRTNGSKHAVNRRRELDVLAGKLDPLLDALTLDEWNEVPTAAEALARRGRGPRAIVIQRPPQTIEVVIARDGHKIVGALLLRRSWMEQAFNKSSVDNRMDAEPLQRNSALGEWLNEFGSLLGSWLSREMALADAQYYLLEPSDCLDLLERFAENKPDELRALWSLPRTQHLVWYLRQGTSDQRRRVRELERQLRTNARGRPEVDREDSRDAFIATEVASACDHLRDGWDHVRANYSDDAEQTRDELAKMGYRPDEVDVLMIGQPSRRRGRPRSLRSVAIALIARRLNRSEDSISVQASRGARI